MSKTLSTIKLCESATMEELEKRQGARGTLFCTFDKMAVLVHKIPILIFSVPPTVLNP